MKPTQTSTPSTLFVSRIQRTTVQNLQAMPQRESVRFTSSSFKIPIFSPLHHHHLCDSSIHLFSDPESLPQIPNYSETHLALFRHTHLHKSHQEVKHFAELINTQKKANHLNLKNVVNHFINSFKIQSRACPFNPRNAIERFVVSLRNQQRTKPFNPKNAFEHVLNFFKSSKGINPSFPVLSKSSLLCSATLGLTQSDDNVTVAQPKSGGGLSSSRHDEERVLISEVLVRNKDGEALERKDLENEALVALKACRPNSALTVREVQEDVHRIIASGYFCSCMPVAVDTRDGIRLVFQVEPNQEFQGLVCEGANVLPLKFVEDAFRNGYGKVVNIRRLDEVINSINGWYMERGLFGMVSDVEILSGGIIRLQVSEAEVNNMYIRFLDKTGEPVVGNTRPETILRQLTTKKGQVYSMLQGKRDVDTVLAMGIMEDVSIIPQPAGDTGKVDLTMNVVERKNLGISAGGGISSGITSGPLAGLIGSCAIYHRNLFGRNQKLNLSVERGQIDSIFRLNYIDPWIEGDDERTSRSIMIQNSRTPGSLVHGNQPDNSSLTISRVTAGIEYSRPFRPKWNGTAGLIFQHVGARDDNGNPVIRDFYSSPITASGNVHDDMLLAKIECVYSGSGDPVSSMFVLNMDQGLPVWSEWLVFNRVSARVRKGLIIGPAHLHLSLCGGHVGGNFPPHEAFAVGGTNSVRGYEEGAVGSGRSYVVSSGEISFPLLGRVEGALFADYGTDLGSGPTVPGDPAGARLKPGSGFGYGIGVRVDSPLGPLRLEYAFNDQRTGRFHFGVGLRN